MEWNSDKALFALAKRELFPALVGDILDSLDLTHQFLPSEIKPLDSKSVIIGRAMPVLEMDVCASRIESANNPYMDQPFGLMFKALDDLKEDEVYIASGSSFRYAMWGGLMTARARYLHAAGTIVNGFTRDTPDVLAQGYPCFGRGTFSQDQGVRGKVVDWRVPIAIEGVRVDPGDIVFGDLDGIVVVPKAVEAEVFTKALQKGREEKKLRIAVDNGMPSDEAYHTYGIF